jgi:hypothetical protein
MRLFLYISLFLTTFLQAQQHCGYDFTSYIVLHVHEEGKKENIGDLQIMLVEGSGKAAINTNNRYSWKHKDEVLYFSRNHQIDKSGQPILEPDPNAKWYFPFAKDVYLLSVTNEFPADQLMVRISDPKNRFKTQDVQLFAFNMYVLCSTQAEQAMQFGRRINKPIDVVLAKK